MVSGLSADAQDHRAVLIAAGGASDGHTLMTKSAKPDAAAMIAKSLTARENPLAAVISAVGPIADVPL